MTTTLLHTTLATEAQRHTATVAAIESRAADLHVVDRLVVALRARGWKADAFVEILGAVHVVEARLHLAVSVSQAELLDLLGYLTCDGVSCVRVTSGDMGPSRHYLLRLEHCTVSMDAYVHAPAARAA